MASPAGHCRLPQVGRRTSALGAGGILLTLKFSAWHPGRSISLSMSMPPNGRLTTSSAAEVRCARRRARKPSKQAIILSSHRRGPPAHQQQLRRPLLFRHCRPATGGCDPLPGLWQMDDQAAPESLRDAGSRVLQRRGVGQSRRKHCGLKIRKCWHAES